MLTIKSLLALAALFPALSLAAPTTSTPSSSEVETVTKPFTFSSWVEDLLNPDLSVVALTPDQAIEAYYASTSSPSTTSPSTTEEKNKISKRAGNPVCLNGAARVNIADAVAVINEMASQGEKYYTINAGWTTLWMAGAARLTGVLADTATAQRIWARHIAQTGGRIMDYCTNDGTTGGMENGYGNGFTVISLDNKWR